MATTSSVASSSANTLDVPTLVSQLMSIERQPIDKLNTKVTSYQSKISSFGTLSGLVSGFQTTLQSLNTSLQGFSAISSDASIFSASATSTTAAGTYSVAVTNLAQSQNLVAAGRTSSSTAISDGTATTVSFDFGTIGNVPPGTLTGGVYSGANFTSNGTVIPPITIDATNNTLQGIRDAINAANAGVTASIINDGSTTPYRLSITSNTSGVSSSLKISTAGGDGTINALLGYDPGGLPAAQNLNQAVAAQNAILTVNGITVSKTSNTITDAIQGVTLTLSKLTTAPATLTVARDTSTVSTAASGFVDAYNALASQLKSRSAYGSATTAPPVLAGDGTVRLMLDQLRGILNTAATPASGGTLTYLSQIGISTQADGTLKLDTSKLSSAMTNNFSDVANLFSSTTGYATRLNTWATGLVASGGLIALRTDSLNTSIKHYNDQISRLEIRMTILRKQFTTTYSNLNVLLSSMNSTSSYLTQQLSKL